MREQLTQSADMNRDLNAYKKELGGSPKKIHDHKLV